MSKPKPIEPQTKKTLQLPDRLWADIAEYRSQEAFGSEAEAVRRLLRESLAAWRKKNPAK